MVKLIPKISQKIEEVLKKLGLRPKESPEKFIERTKKRKHRYSSLCQDKKGKNLIFYARLHDSIFEKKKMENEAKIAQVLKKKKISKIFPKYFESKIEKDFEWIMREYFIESPLESQKEIEKLKRKLKDWEIKEIAKAVFSIQKINLRYFTFLKRFDVKKYLKLEEEILKEKIVSEKEKLKILLKGNEKILRNENHYLCHGDLQIGNILLFDKNLKIIDWELAHINNFAFDIAFLFSRLWKEKETRRKILNSFLFLLPRKKFEIFKVLFRIDCLFLGYHSFEAKPREYSLEMLKKRKEFFKNLIKKSLESFESLRKI